jgi:hypothetical protein
MLWQGTCLVAITIANSVHHANLCCCSLQAIHAFRAAGKRLLFVTNNSGKSRQEYVAKFKSLGLEVAAEEVLVRQGCDLGAGLLTFTFSFAFISCPSAAQQQACSSAL